MCLWHEWTQMAPHQHFPSKLMPMGKCLDSRTSLQVNRMWGDRVQETREVHHETSCVDSVSLPLFHSPTHNSPSETRSTHNEAINCFSVPPTPATWMTQPYIVCPFPPPSDVWPMFNTIWRIRGEAIDEGKPWGRGPPLFLLLSMTPMWMCQSQCQRVKLKCNSQTQHEYINVAVDPQPCFTRTCHQAQQQHVKPNVKVLTRSCTTLFSQNMLSQTQIVDVDVPIHHLVWLQHVEPNTNISMLTWPSVLSEVETECWESNMDTDTRRMLVGVHRALCCSNVVGYRSPVGREWSAIESTQEEWEWRWWQYPGHAEWTL